MLPVKDIDIGDDDNRVDDGDDDYKDPGLVFCCIYDFVLLPLMSLFKKLQNF